MPRRRAVSRADSPRRVLATVSCLAASDPSRTMDSPSPTVGATPANSPLSCSPWAFRKSLFRTAAASASAARSCLSFSKYRGLRAETPSISAEVKAAMASSRRFWTHGGTDASRSARAGLSARGRVSVLEEGRGAAARLVGSAPPRAADTRPATPAFLTLSDRGVSGEAICCPTREAEAPNAP